MVSLAKTTYPAQTTDERVFVPCCSRMIATHTGVVVACSVLGLFLSLSLGRLHSAALDILSILIFWSFFDIAGLLFFTLLYGLNRELFSIKIDAVSVTGPCRFCARNILRREIDPARSMHRNLIDRCMFHWHIRDANGNGISISGMDFRRDEIAEIFKTISLEGHEQDRRADRT
jgi:hypothetical protein